MKLRSICLLVHFLIINFGIADVLRVPEDVPTIQKAINVARDGDTILISPGEFHEVITLRSGIILRGSGEATKLSESIKLIDVDRTTVSSLLIKGKGQDSHFGIFCVNSDVQIRDVTVRAFHHGISVEDSQLIMIRSKIIGSFNVGILIAQNTKATIEESEIYNNTIGITIGATPQSVLIRGNRIRKNKIGIEIHGANPTLRENVIDRNFVGVQIENANPDLGTKSQHGKNIFTDNTQTAIRCDGIKPIFALMNWWGQTTGPSGKQVQGRIRIDPWLHNDPTRSLKVDRTIFHFTTFWGALK